MCERLSGRILQRHRDAILGPILHALKPILVPRNSDPAALFTRYPTGSRKMLYRLEWNRTADPQFSGCVFLKSSAFMELLALLNGELGLAILAANRRHHCRVTKFRRSV